MHTFIFAVGLYLAIGCIGEMIFRFLIFFISKYAAEAHYITKDGKVTDVTGKGLNLNKVDPITFKTIFAAIVEGPWHLIMVLIMIFVIIFCSIRDKLHRG